MSRLRISDGISKGSWLKKLQRMEKDDELLMIFESKILIGEGVSLNLIIVYTFNVHNIILAGLC